MIKDSIKYDLIPFVIK